MKPYRDDATDGFQGRGPALSRSISGVIPPEELIRRMGAARKLWIVNLALALAAVFLADWQLGVVAIFAVGSGVFLLSMTVSIPFLLGDNPRVPAADKYAQGMIYMRRSCLALAVTTGAPATHLLLAPRPSQALDPEIAWMAIPLGIIAAAFVFLGAFAHPPHSWANPAVAIWSAFLLVASVLGALSGAISAGNRIDLVPMVAPSYLLLLSLKNVRLGREITVSDFLRPSR